MDFEFSYEQRALAESLSRFIGEAFPSRATVQHVGVDREPGAAWAKLAEIGAIGVLFPHEAGGYGEGAFDVVNVFEVLGRERLVDQPFLPVLLAGAMLSVSGPHRALFQALLEGEAVVTLAHCEADGAWEPEYVTTRARRHGDAWVLDGIKAGVPHGGQARFMIATARVSGASADADGIGAFLVPMDHEGVRVRAYPEIDGGQAAEVHLNAVAVGGDALIGAPGQAFEMLETSLAWGVLALCAQAVGAMDRLMEATIEYLKVRCQFDVPIGGNQALQHRVVEMMLAIEQSRSAVINAAAAPAPAGTLCPMAVAAAKITVGRAATLVAEEAIQLHGGIGMTWELDAAHYAGWLSMFDLRMGGEEVHLERYLRLKDFRAGNG